MFFPILRGQWWLSCVSLSIALLHVVVVLIGPDAYSFFGGPGLARQAESGLWQSALMTLALPLALRRLRGLWALGGGRDPAPALAGRRAALDRRALHLPGARHRRPDGSVAQHGRLTAAARRIATSAGRSKAGST